LSRPDSGKINHENPYYLSPDFAVTVYNFTKIDGVHQQVTQSRTLLLGYVFDRDSGEPVPYTSIILLENNRSSTSHEDGFFAIANLSPGEYTLRAQRVGFEPYTGRITVLPADTTRIEIRLRSTVFRSGSIEVTARRHSNGDEIITPEFRLDGRELRQQLGRTLAETLQNEPGMAQSTMGPAPARPVLRGMSGDRLVLLEDGRTTGDVSTSAPDHAVAIDPINASYIEILRGPSALVYTSNAMAGVVNVVRGQIPTEIPEHFHGMATVQGESVNTGLSAAASTYGSLGNLALKADFGLRTAADIRTPAGSLDNTAILNLHGGAGASRIGEHSMTGFSANAFVSSYGIPGDFLGAHPRGVKIDMQRYQADLRHEVYPAASWLLRARYDYTFSFYFHEEREYSPLRNRHDIIGYQANVVRSDMAARYYHGRTGPFEQGIFGFSAGHTWNRPGGLTFTPLTNTLAAAVFTYQEFSVNRWSVQTGLRADLQSVLPIEEVLTQAGLRTNRTFFNASGGIRAGYQLSPTWQTIFSLMRTTRMPGVEELFSEGPHLPAYSFEIGNPALDEEIGHGLEWNLQYSTGLLGVRTSVYYYTFTNYLYPRNTGQESVRRPLPIYQFTGEPARLYGNEWVVGLRFPGGFVINGTASYVLGDLTDRDEPLPFIPPLTGKLDFQYAWRVFTIGTSLRFASAQNRLSEFEEATDAYRVADAFFQAHFAHGNHMHTISVTLENATNETYRMHLSRVKSIMPEPGRNLKALYRLYF
jgi:iron complex outermembrane recepter protein